MIWQLTPTLIYTEFFPFYKHINFSKVGRAGRFGTKGMAVSFISTEEDS